MRKNSNWPCRDCYDRKPGCHERCERYIEHRKTVKTENETVRAQRNVIIMQDCYEKEKCRRIKG